MRCMLTTCCLLTRVVNRTRAMSASAAANRKVISIDVISDTV